MSRLDPPHRLKWDRLSALYSSLCDWAEEVEREESGDKAEKIILSVRDGKVVEKDNWIIDKLGPKTNNGIAFNSVQMLRRLVASDHRPGGTVDSEWLSTEVANNLVALYNRHYPDRPLAPLGVESYHGNFKDLCENHPAFAGKIASWEQSEEWEREAEEVMCITHDMTWAISNMNNILTDLNNDKFKEHRYIVTDSDWTSRTVNTTIKNMRFKARGMGLLGGIESLDSRFRIRRLNNPVRTDVDYMDMIPPLPADIVLYGRTKVANAGVKSVVVMSAFPVEQPITEDKMKWYFDCILGNSGYNDRFVVWFNRVWNLLGRDVDLS